VENRKSGRPRVVVVGAGAMGSIFGAALDAVAEVVLLDLWAEHVAAIRRDGLIVEGAGGRTRTVRLAAETDPAAVAGGVDLALIFTKSSATRDAAETARRLLGPDGSALTLQNGLGNADRVAEVLGPDRTLAGITAHGGTVLGPGRVRHAGEGETHIAGAGPGARPGPVADLLTRAGIAASVADDPDALIWGKLVVNAGINALAALLRVPNGTLAEVPACDALMASAVAEAVAVARRGHRLRRPRRPHGRRGRRRPHPRRRLGGHGGARLRRHPPGDRRRHGPPHRRRGPGLATSAPERTEGR
jgi:2-dehydropantoate 2-reductase